MSLHRLALAATAGLALPGCIIHVDGYDHDWDGRTHLAYGDYGSGPRVRGNGVLAQEARPVDLDGVSAVVVEGGMRVAVAVGNPAAAEVSGDENVLPHVRVEVEGDVLVISMERGRYDLDQPLAVAIELPSLDEVRVEGSADVAVRGLFGPRLVAAVLGSGDLALEGEVEALDLRVDGSGDLDARGVDARAASVVVSGSGDVALGGIDELRAEVRGSGDVTYDGRPASRDVEVRGSGTVRAR